ncbi:SusC/RagA family TonB-linked outer membrane protein [Larkinella terrae]|nr:SusC/RagA family TonB-linked outer membrane protein [Larkinella terrae]
MSKSFTKKEVFALMKITLTQLILVGVIVGNAVAYPVVAQELLKERVNLSLKNSNLRLFLRSLEQQVDVVFSYQKGVIELDEKLNLTIQGETVDNVLKQVLIPRRIHYRVINSNQIILTRIGDLKSEQGKVESINPLEFPDHEKGVDRVVTGRVTDEKGESLPGVSILVKGSQQGTTTDSEGKFRQSVVDGNAVLVFSYVGYVSQEITVGNQTAINLTLKEDAKSLDEVVVTSFGIEREKKALFYATQEVKGAQLTSVGNPNVLNSLQGKVAGVSVRLNSGMPGKAPQITIRGNRSITGNNQPLYVIDGLPVAGGVRVNDLNPNDIESMNILKGPAASALYGLRASNGVVVIKTKSGGRSGKPTISFDSHFNVDEVARLPKMQDVYSQGLNGKFDLNQIWTWGAKISDIGTYTNEFGEQEVARAYDNDRDFYQRGHTVSNNLSLADGGEYGHFLIGAGQTSQTGIVEGSGLKRYNIKFNGEMTKIKNVTVGLSLNYSDLTVDDYPELGGNDNYFRGLTDVPPSYNLKGKRYASPANPFQQVYYRAGQNNPYWVVNHNSRQNKTNRTFGNLLLRYDIRPELSVTYRVGIDYFNNKEVDFQELGTATRGRTLPPSGGSLTINNSSQNQINSNLFVTYDKNIGEKLNLNAIVGNELYDINSSNDRTAGSDFVTGGWANLNNATNVVGSNSISRQRVVGFYGNLSLGWNKILFLNASGRNDVASNMPTGNRSFFYPSIGGSFILSDALSFQKRTVSLIKLRASYAEVGQVGPVYVNNAGFVKGSPGGFVFPFNGLTGLTQSSTRIDPNLRPENTKTIELGADLKFFNDRISLEYTYFNSKSDGQIYSVPVPLSTGASAEIRNAGSMLSKGHEVVLGITPVTTAAFTWDLGINFTSFDNTVQSLAEGVNRIVLSDPIVAEAGYAYPSIYGRSYLRDPASGQLVINNDTKSSTYGFPLTDNNLKVIGSTVPDFELNISNSLRYKNLSLSAQLDWRQGGVFWNHGLAEANWRGLSVGTLDREQDVVLEGVQGRWNGTQLVVEGPNTIKIKKEYPYYSQLWTNYESQLSDASFVRLRELTLNYAVPVSKLGLKWAKSLSVYLSARNVFLISDAFSDPEVNYSEGGNNIAGYGRSGITPQTRSFGGGLKISL